LEHIGVCYELEPEQLEPEQLEEWHSQEEGPEESEDQEEGPEESEDQEEGPEETEDQERGGGCGGEGRLPRRILVLAFFVTIPKFGFCT
jgi:hypothetical protein